MKSQIQFTYSLVISFLMSWVLLSGSWAAANPTEMDLDSLGNDPALVKKAADMDPHNSARIILKRQVDRSLRFELGIAYGPSLNGDPNVSSYALGGNLDFHFTPRWSLGARYNSFQNSLSSRGQQRFEAAQSNPNSYSIPAVDYPNYEELGVINFYPAYGKLNFFNMSVIQFDVYLLAGAGSIQESNGSSGLYTAGLGMAFWLSQHFSSRIEARWENYDEHDYLGSRNLNPVVASFGFGFLL